MATILQWLTIALIIFALSYNHIIFNTLPEIDQPRPSVSKVLGEVRNHDSIRKDYGIYGRDLSEDYREYKESVQKSQGAASVSSLVEAVPDVLSGPASDSSGKPISDPGGVRGNNYSIYDIKSPGGPFSQP